MLLHGRTRLGPTELYSRQDGIRPVAKAIKSGLPFYYLPDMDLGARDSVFVPFFGVPAATVFAFPEGFGSYAEALPVLAMVVVPAVLMVTVLMRTP